MGTFIGNWFGHHGGLAAMALATVLEVGLALAQTAPSGGNSAAPPAGGNANAGAQPAAGVTAPTATNPNPNVPRLPATGLNAPRAGNDAKQPTGAAQDPAAGARSPRTPGSAVDEAGTRNPRTTPGSAIDGAGTRNPRRTPGSAVDEAGTRNPRPTPGAAIDSSNRRLDRNSTGAVRRRTDNIINNRRLPAPPQLDANGRIRADINRAANEAGEILDETRGAARDAISGARDAARDARRTLRDVRDDIAVRRETLRLQDLRAPDVGLWFETGRNGLFISDLATQGVVTGLGFQEGDQIVSVNGHLVTTDADFMRQLTAANNATNQIRVVVMRDGREETLRVDTNELLAGAGAVPPIGAVENFGLVLDDRFDNRVVVWRVVPRSAAFYAGLRPGDVITLLDGRPLTAADDLDRLITRGGAATLDLQVRRGERTRNLRADLPEVESEARTAPRPVRGEASDPMRRAAENREAREQLRDAPREGANDAAPRNPR